MSIKGVRGGDDKFENKLKTKIGTGKVKSTHQTWTEQCVCF
jgi:hypothetical protein